MPQPNTSFNIGQSETVTVTPEDANGNPGLLDSVTPSWSAADTTIVQVQPATNGLSAILTGLKPGSTTVNVHGNSSTAANIDTSFAVTINESPATQFGFTFGSPQ